MLFDLAAQPANLLCQILAVIGPDRGVGVAGHQQQGRRVSSCIGDWLGHRHIRDDFEDRLHIRAGQRQEIIGAGYADPACQPGAVDAILGEIGLVQEQHHGDIGAG